MKIIHLTTNDGITLEGAYYTGTTTYGVVCLHQFKSTKESFDFFAQRLQTEGYHVLSVDLRGHGNSQGALENFTEDNFRAMFHDARAADEWLRTNAGVTSMQMVGASIGANTALIYQEMNTLESVVALSPGLNYHGINPQDSNMSNIVMPVLYINSEGDRYSEETKQLYLESPVTQTGNTRLHIYPGSAHGVHILTDNPEAQDDSIAWLKEHAGRGLADFKGI